MKALRILVMSLLLAGMFGSNALASVIFDGQLTPGPYVRVPVTQNPYASFSTGGNAFTLTRVEVFLFPPASPRTGSLMANLYADNNTFPGTLIGSVGTVADNDRNFAPSGTARWTVSYDLAANTRYWIGLSTSNNSSNLWEYGGSIASPDNTGVVGEYRVVGGQLYSNSLTDSVFEMTISGTAGAPAAVPEPSTYALLCISLGVVGYARRRMAKGRIENHQLLLQGE